MKHVRREFVAEMGDTSTGTTYFQEKDGRSVLETLKVASTPAQPEQAVTEGAGKLISEWSDAGEMLHGSAAVTDTVLERKGVRPALLVMEGFANIPEIQRGDKENVYDLSYQRRKPTILRNMMYPATERVTTDGDVLKVLEEDQIWSIAQELKREDVKSVEMYYPRNYAFADREVRTKEILGKEFLNAIIIVSYEVFPQFWEYERSSTVVTASYIAPTMVDYTEKLYGDLRHRNSKGEIFIIQSDGGITFMGALRKEVARILLSGPVAGATGAALMAYQPGIHSITTLDIGGTSVDARLTNNGESLVSTENKIGGPAIAVPMLDTVIVGTGGGSIAWLDSGGMLQIGPRSTEATSEPACYDRGGDWPTVSDALIYRGSIRPEHFARGNYPLNVENARHVMAEPAGQVHASPDEVAEVVIRIMETNTMQVMRLTSAERGHDARQYTMAVLGGGRDLHIANVAQESRTTNVLVPCYAGILSSSGPLMADVVRDYVQIHVTRCTDITPEMFREQFS